MSLQPTYADVQAFFASDHWRTALRVHGEAQAGYLATLPGVVSAIYDEAKGAILITLNGMADYPVSVTFTVDGATP